MWNYSDDPAADWDAYCEAMDEEEREMIASAPKCEECGRSVAEADSSYCYEFDGVYFCVDCMDKKLRAIPYYQ